MRKSMIAALLTILCVSLAGCDNSGESESQQPDIIINYAEDENANSSSVSKKPDGMNASDNMNSADNPELSDAEHNKDESPPDSRYELFNLANNDVSIISGREYDYSETNIHGTVLGIGKYTVTMNRAFTAEYTPDGEYIDENTMVSMEDPDEQVIEYVQFLEESTFTLRETKNGGADGKDSPAAFDDIKKGDLLDIRGYYVDGIFNAINTIIYRNLDLQ